MYYHVFAFKFGWGKKNLPSLAVLDGQGIAASLLYNWCLFRTSSLYNTANLCR